jgi:hypothetical protein
MKPPQDIGKRKLNLKRETVHNLADQLLTTQGHSLWTCPNTRPAGALPESEERGGRRRRAP